MTCIVGMFDEKSNKVIIGGDSAAIMNSNIFIKKDPKVFKNGNFVFGCAGSFRMMQLLRFSFKPPKVGNKDIYEYMCTDFVKEMRHCFEKHDFLEMYKEHEGVFLLAYNDRLFKVQPDFNVGEMVDRFDSCGCGEDFALGVMFTLSAESIPTESKILKALEAAEHLSTGVSSPFVVIST